MAEEQEYIRQSLQRDWGILLPDQFTVQEIIDKIAAHIATLIDRDPEAFFQLMYRLDVPEHKLNEVLYSEDAAQLVARLIYNRQLQKIKSRKSYKDPNKSTDADLTW